MIINPCGKRLNKEVMQKLAQVEPATVGHFLSSGVMISDFRSSLGGKRIVGHAVTLKLPTIDSVLCHHVLEVALPGDIVVIDRGGNQTHACWGAAMTYAAKSRFLAGAVIDGSVTDILDVQRMNFPVFYRRLSALTTKLLGIDGDINVPIHCGGVVVRPDDIIICDTNGVVVIPPDQAEMIADKALAEQHKEIDQFKAIDSGIPLGELSGANKFLDRYTRY